MNPGEILENAFVADAGAEGKAVVRHGELVIFVRNAVPGDIIDLKITHRKKSFCEGKLLRLVQPSEKRDEPFCKHFGICGGCKWQNMKYEHQLFYKQKLVEDNLIRIGKLEIEEFLPILPSPLTRHYRNKMEYSFSDTRFLTGEDRDIPDEQKNMNALGFFVSPSWFRVLDIEQCYLPNELSDRIRNHVRAYALEKKLIYYNFREHRGFLRCILTRTTMAGECMVIMVFGHEDKECREDLLNDIASAFPEITSLMYVLNYKKNDNITDQKVLLYKGKDHITEQIEDVRFRIGPLSFFQTNSYQAVGPEKVVYDLYTGTGTIANFVAHLARKVVGIEYVASAVEDARVNAQINNITNTDFFAGDLAKVLDAEFVLLNGQPDVLITDPPRAGMHEKVVKQILDIAPDRIVYVSCNPATQARDAAMLKEMYRIVKVQPVDMFPHTQHVENVMLLEKKS
jgi:23S rRNA (uracil1939-C5)-methyltransferase